MDVGKQNRRRPGPALAVPGTGGIFGDTFKKIYDSIDVLIGGGPLILDKSTGCA